MLRYWQHPKKAQVRFYVDSKTITEALEATGLLHPANIIKAYYATDDSKQPTGNLKVFIGADSPVPASEVQALKDEIHSRTSDALLESWQETQGDSDPDEETKSAVQRETPKKMEHTRQQKTLNLQKIELPSKVVLELSARETQLMATLLENNEQVSTCRKQGAMADIRLISPSGVELLVNRLRINKADEESQATTLKESVDSKALFLDAEKLTFRTQTSNHPIIPVVLLEGSAESTKLKLAQLDGIEAFLIGSQRLSVLQTLGIEHSAHMILKLIQQVLTDEERVREHYIKPKILVDQQSHLLQSLPGVSETTAEAMLRHFGAIQKVLQASESDLSKIKGIGPKKAREIAKVLGTQLFA